MDWWHPLVGLAVGLLACWVALLVTLVLLSRGRDTTTLREAMRLLPDLIRLMRRLAADRELPRGLRVRLGLLLIYLLIPLDLVPDIIPLVGHADDAIIVALAVRSVVRTAGPEALATHWPGTPTGLAVVHRLAGLPAPGA
jgi:uncharacterized membrane protein YkvA (DUF1232 family)